MAKYVDDNMNESSLDIFEKDRILHMYIKPRKF